MKCKSCTDCINFRAEEGRKLTVRCIVKNVAKKDEANKCESYEVKK